ncbi:MAG: hypothetical protein HYX97_04465 [Chloroflexi bacterium]|nr:hypothetical protein [Chloroflexota bacterium]
MTATQKRLLWDEVQEGAALPSYTVKCGYMEMNRFAGPNDEFVPIHMDPDYAKNEAELPGVIIMGNLKIAYITDALEDWAGPDAWVRKVSVQFRGMDLVNQTLTASGQVKRKYTEHGKRLVECEVWVDNDQGQRGTVGTAIVELQARAS